MSKIYNEYLRLKEKNNTKLYLFHSGKFYIFIADDCDLINNYMVLKKTKFTNDVNKCGFPSSKLEDYLRVFKNNKLDVEVIDKIEDCGDTIDIKYNKIKNILDKVDINNITPLESIQILSDLKRLIDE